MEQSKIIRFIVRHRWRYFAGLLALGAGLWLAQFFVWPASIPSRASFSLSAADEGLRQFFLYKKGMISEVLETVDDEYDGRVVGFRQDVRVVVGEAQFRTQFATQPGVIVPKLAVGDRVVVTAVETGEGQSEYVIVDRYRLPALSWVVGLFCLLVLLVGLWRGFASLLGLAFSFAILVFGVAPNILLGRDPVVVTLVGGALVVLVNTFLSHGLRSQSVLALAATIISLAAGLGAAYAALPAVQLFGTADSTLVFLQSGMLGALQLPAIFMAAIIIGALGVLDDVIVTQIESVHQLSEVNASLSQKELFVRGMAVGRHHIAAVINTLMLAYAAVALPLLLLVLATASEPAWVVLNSEQVAEEIVRSVLGSGALILAVPIATALAAVRYGRRPVLS